MKRKNAFALYKRKNHVTSRIILKGKTVIGIGCIALFIRAVYFGKISADRIYYMFSCIYIPVVTYEEQYGKTAVTYENDYRIPEWFLNNEEEDKKEEADTTGNKGELGELAKDKMERDNNLTKELASEKDENDINTIQVAANSKIVYTEEQLQNKDFLKNKIFAIDGNTNMTDEELSVESLLKADMSVDGLKSQQDSSGKPQYKILIYHTHGSESFCDSRPGKKEDTIIGVGEYLTKILKEKYNISVYHDQTVYDVIDGVNDRSAAYDNAYQNVSKILEENPSIEVVIDLHRDGVDEDTHLVTNVDGKKTAKIMFLNGVSRSNANGEIDYLKNPNRQMNLAFSFQMLLKGRELYGDYIRKIYVKSLRFNLHLMPRATLIEAGAQNNTIEEEKNAMEPLAAILNAVLSGENDK